MKPRDKQRQKFKGMFTRYVMVFDIAATCPIGGDLPEEEMETIDFYGIILDREQGWTAVDTWCVSINPEVHPTLTEFCMKLTGVTQFDLRVRGVSYKDAAKAVSNFAAPYAEELSWCSWSTFDRQQMARDLSRHGVSLVPHDRIINLQKWFCIMNREDHLNSLTEAVGKVEKSPPDDFPKTTFANALCAATIFKHLVA